MDTFSAWLLMLTLAIACDARSDSLHTRNRKVGAAIFGIVGVLVWIYVLLRASVLIARLIGVTAP